MYVPLWEVPPTQLKPGQISLERQLYSEEVKDHEETYMESEIERGSIYQRSIVGRLQPQDYFFPQKPIRPTEPKEGGGHHSTAHWKSEYRSNVNDAARFDTLLYRQNGPSYQIANPPTCVSGGEQLSSYSEAFGKYGSDPRHKLGQDNKLPAFKTALTVGTTKGTAHIPGYQGFLATNTANPKVAAIAHGGNLRTTDKTNLTQTYQTNMIGYAGHKPSNAINDKGAVALTTLTTKGKDFAPPPASAYIQG